MKEYPSKISRIKKCKEILNREYIGDDDNLFLEGLIKNHPNYHQKKGLGIKCFKIGKTVWGKRGFYIVRTDGTETDFSYNQCINPRNELSNIKAACRESISEDIRKLTTPGKIAHHEKISFIDIFNEWIKDKDISKIKISSSEDGQEKRVFDDISIREDFRTFHNSRASIISISKEDHYKIHWGEKDDTNS